MNVLVTGGAGFIGSHTCKQLARAGFVPIVYDNLSTGHLHAVKWGPFVQGDLEDKAKLASVIQRYQPQGVLHFAANALVVESMHEPEKYYRNNVAGTLALLEVLRQSGVNRLVFSSSCATYGNPQAGAMTEEHPQNPINPYGRTKLMVEQMMGDFFMAYGLQTAVLRYFNAAGADLDGELGEEHEPETHLLPSIIQAALGVKPEIVVYGTNFATKDGSAVRDYIHVQDLAEAHVLALQHLLKSKDSITLNLGTGRGYSVLELIAYVQKCSAKTVPVRFEKSRPGEPGVLTANASKAAAVLGWTARHSSLETIVGSAWKWHQQLTPNLRKAYLLAKKDKGQMEAKKEWEGTVADGSEKS